MIKIKNSIIAIVILLLLFILNCDLERESEYNQNPFQSFEAQVFLTERNSENQNYFNFNDEPKVIENSFLSGESFDFIQISELIGLAFSQEDQKIIKVSKKGDGYTSEAIAESGSGPNQIENGIRLINSGDEILLIQRNRVSKVIIDGKHKLEALMNIPLYLNFYSEIFSMDSLIINTYGFENRSTLRLVDSSFDLIKYKGGKTVNKNQDINKVFNFNVVSVSNSNNYYIQAFLFLPYVGIFDKKLDLKSVIKFNDFSTVRLDENDLENGDVSMIDTELHTVLAGLHPFGDDKFWIIYEDRFYSEKDKSDFSERRVNKTYHYYEINKNLKVEFKGESKEYLIPFNNTFISLEDGSLVYY